LAIVIAFRVVRRPVTEFAVESLFVEPRRANGNLEVVESSPVIAVIGEYKYRTNENLAMVVQ